MPALALLFQETCFTYQIRVRPRQYIQFEERYSHAPEVTGLYRYTWGRNSASREKSATELSIIHQRLQPISHKDEGSPEVRMGEGSLGLGDVARRGALGAGFVCRRSSMDKFDLRLAQCFGLGELVLLAQPRPYAGGFEQERFLK